MALITKTSTEPVPLNELEPRWDRLALVKQLADPGSSKRRDAARDLAHCPDGSADLIARLKIEPEASVREVLLTSLAQLADPAALAGLIDCLRSDDAALRNEVIEAMKQLPNEVGPAMKALLADPDPDVRIFVVNILESLCHPDVVHWLIEVIENDPHVNVCAAALDLLGEVGAPVAREPLVRLKARFADEPYIQFAAELALKRMEGV